MTRSHLSRPPARPRYHADAAKLHQLRRLSEEEATEDGLEDWMAASGDSSSAR